MNKMTLGSILKKSERSNNTAIIMKDPLNQVHKTITYTELIDRLENITGNCRTVFNNGSKNLIALYGQWFDKFYELILSIAYSNNAFFIIDPQWPQSYIIKLLNMVKPNFIIFEKMQTQIFRDQVVNRLECEYINVDKDKLKVLDEYGYATAHWINKNLEINYDLAYVICTSGTTGEPKIVKVLNSSIIPNLIDLSKMFGMNNKDIVYQASPLTFDPSIIEIFMTILSNAQLLVLLQQLKLMPVKLNQTLSDSKVTFLQLTPTLFRNVFKSQNIWDSIRCIVLGGEMFPYKSDFIPQLIQRNIQLFNIYGITEMSCWATCYQVQIEDLRDANGVPIGSPLSETELLISLNDTNEAVKLETLKEESYRMPIEGTLLLFSTSRICYLNSDESSQHKMKTGDMVQYYQNKLFCKGRIDRAVKINGKLTNLNYLEEICKRCDFVDNCIATTIDLFENFGLIVFLVVKRLDIEEEKSYREELFKYINNNLPSHYKPHEVVFYHEPLPLTANGKVDIKVLINKYKQENKKNPQKRSESDIKDVDKLIYDIWKNILGNYPKLSDNFILSGGNSLQAVEFLNSIEKSVYEMTGIQETKFVELFDYILNNTVQDIISNFKRLFVTDNYKKIKLNNNNKNDSNKMSDVTPKEFEDQYNLIGYASKLQYHSSEQLTSNLSNIDAIDLQIIWKFDTLKCIDATPLCVSYNNETEYVYIGSHSSLFVCLNAKNGEVVWKFNAKDRIESSACISECGTYVIFGSYDKNVYFIKANNGELYWSYETGDVVKCSPVVDRDFVYFGSHDKNIYCLHIILKTLVWKFDLDSSSIYASPTIDNCGHLFVATLRGNLFCLNKQTGSTVWSLQLEKPCFATPIVQKDKEFLFIGTCGGLFYCISTQGEVKWKFETSSPIFSTCRLYKNIVFLGSYDGFLYCLEQDNGNVFWKFSCENKIYATPILLNIDSESRIICVNTEGVTNIINFDGTRNTKFNFNSEIFSSPIIFNNKLYVGCRDNNLYCLSIN